MSPEKKLRPAAHATVSSNSEASPADSNDSRIVAALEEYLSAVEAGVPVQREAILLKYADVASALGKCLDGLDLIQAITPSCANLSEKSAPAPGPLADTPKSMGDFRLVRVIGRGGMGVVYEAEQVSLGRRIAVKILPFAAIWPETSLERFRNEVRIAARLEHPNIVPIYGVGCERGVNFYAMKLIDGGSLADVIKIRAATRRGLQEEVGTVQSGVSGLEQETSKAESQTREFSIHSHFTGCQSSAAGLATASGPQWYLIAARLGHEAALALAFAHQQGVIHRDIKPSNLLLDREGHLFVADFGLARCEMDVSLTRTGDLLGTPRYMSPEQASGSSKQLNASTDIYSLGATLYELLTLHPIVAARDRAGAIRALKQPQIILPRSHDQHLPRPLEQILLKCLQFNPADRYRTAAELADDLQRFLDGRQIAARPIGSAHRAARWVQRHRRIAISTIATLALCLLLLPVGSWISQHSGYVSSNPRGPPAAVEEDTFAADSSASDSNPPQVSPEMLRAPQIKNNGQPPNYSTRRRLLLEKLDYRRLLASVPWNEVTELSVPFGLTGAGSSGEWRSVAMDGDNLVVGVRNNDQVATDAGAAYVYQRDNNGTVGDVGDDKWPLVATLFGNSQNPQASDLKTGDFFGSGVQIDADWMFIGADHPQLLADPSAALGDGRGVVYVYRREAGAWQYTQKLEPSNRGSNQDRFGQFIAIEGNLAAISSPGDENVNGMDAGAVHLFRFDGNSWVQTAKLISGDVGVGAVGFGFHVDLDGGEVVVESLGADGVSADTGAVYVFSEVAGQWQQTAKLVASDGQTNDSFGFWLDREGNTIVVGAHAADVTGVDSGSAYVFESVGGTWSQTARLVSSDLEALDRFGRRVAINNGTILVGGWYGNGHLPNTGAVYAFERVAGQWTEVDKLFQSDRTSAAVGGQQFGDVLEFGSSGEVVIVSGGQGGGNVYVFAQDATRITTAFQNTTPKALADRKGKNPGVTTSTINVADAGTILDLDVRLDITYPRDSDLGVVLVSPTGTQIPLFAQVGGTGDNFTTTVLDSQASTPIASGSAPFTGRFKPTGNLSILTGTNLQGAWQLVVTDSAQGSAGTLKGWSLRVKYQPQTLASSAATTNSSQVDAKHIEVPALSDGAVIYLQSPDPTPLSNDVPGSTRVKRWKESTDNLFATWDFGTSLR